MPRRAPAMFTATPEYGPDGVRVRVRGELDLATAPAFETALVEVERTRPAMIVLDFAELDFIDARGLRSVLECSRRARARGCRLAAIGVNAWIRSLFELTALDQTIEVLSEPASGTGRFRRPTVR